MDPDADPDPSFFIIDLQDAKKKKFKFFLLITFLRYPVLLHHFSKKKLKKFTKQ